MSYARSHAHPKAATVLVGRGGMEPEVRAAKLDQAFRLISASAPFLKAAERLGIETRELGEDNTGSEQLEALLTELMDT